MADIQALLQQVVTAANKNPDVLAGLKGDPTAAIAGILGSSAAAPEVGQVAALLQNVDLASLQSKLAGEDGKLDMTDILGEDGKLDFGDIANIASKLMK